MKISPYWELGAMLHPDDKLEAAPAQNRTFEEAVKTSPGHPVAQSPDVSSLPGDCDESLPREAEEWLEEDREKTFEEAVKTLPSHAKVLSLAYRKKKLSRPEKKAARNKKLSERDLIDLVKVKSQQFGILAYQQTGCAGDDFRVDLLFEGLSQAETFRAADILPFSLTSIVISPADLGLDLEPVLSESDLIYIAEKSSSFSTALDVKVEQGTDEIQARFRSVTDLNLFLLTRSETIAAEKSLGSLRLTQRPTQCLVPGDNGRYNLCSTSSFDEIFQESYDFKQEIIIKEDKFQYYRGSFKTKSKMFTFFFASKKEILKMERMFEVRESKEKVWEKRMNTRKNLLESFRHPPT